MKIYVLILSILFFVPIVNKTSVDGVVKAMNRGNASQLAEYFDTNVEVKLGDKKVVYSKAQAELVLKDFFNTNTVKNFEVLRLKTSNNVISCCEGNLNTVNGLYHTMIHLKQSANEYLIKEIAFDK